MALRDTFRRQPSVGRQVDADPARTTAPQGAGPQRGHLPGDGELIGTPGVRPRQAATQPAPVGQAQGERPFVMANTQELDAVWTGIAQELADSKRGGIEGLEPGTAPTPVEEWWQPDPSDPVAPGAPGDPAQPGDLGLPAGSSIEVSGNAPADAFVGLAAQFIGTPYVWGGANPQGFDCSGLIQYVAAQLGVQLPRVSRDQARVGTAVSVDQAQAGDLIAFPARGLEVGHIGIVVGCDANGELLMLHAPRRGQDVRIDPVGNRKVATVRRVFTEGGR
jgi:cell wall-associated NlpC family hydrolase